MPISFFFFLSSLLWCLEWFRVGGRTLLLNILSLSRPRPLRYRLRKHGHEFAIAVLIFGLAFHCLLRPYCRGRRIGLVLCTGEARVGA